MYDDLYQAHILEHAQHPRHKGILEGATCSGRGRNPNCGDDYILYMNTNAENVIQDIAFDGSGCAISQAAFSLLCDKVQGRKVEEVCSMKEDDVLSLLGVTINAGRLKCALLPLSTLQSVSQCPTSI